MTSRHGLHLITNQLPKKACNLGTKFPCQALQIFVVRLFYLYQPPNTIITLIANVQERLVGQAISKVILESQRALSQFGALKSVARRS